MAEYHNVCRRCGRLFRTKYPFKVDCGRHSIEGKLRVKKELLDKEFEDKIKDEYPK